MITVGSISFHSQEEESSKNFIRFKSFLALLKPKTGKVLTYLGKCC